MAKFGPEVVTLQQWREAAARCGCCPPPLCCEPKLECRSVRVEGTVAGHVSFTFDPGSDSDSDGGDMPELYLKKIVERNGSTLTISSFSSHRTEARRYVTHVFMYDELDEFARSISRVEKYPPTDDRKLVDGVYLTVNRSGPWECHEDPVECIEDFELFRYTFSEDAVHDYSGPDASPQPDDAHEEELRVKTQHIGDDSATSDEVEDCHEEDVITTVPEGKTYYELTGVLCGPSWATEHPVDVEEVTATERKVGHRVVISHSETVVEDWERVPSTTVEVKVTTVCESEQLYEALDIETLSVPVTKDDVSTAGRARLEFLIENFAAICGGDSSGVLSVSSDGCSALETICGSDCYAERRMVWPQKEDMVAGGAGTYSLIDQALVYRWKLNKCCRNQKYRLEWDEVFFPQSFLDWLEDDSSDAESMPPELPEVTPRVWVWSGMPPGCESDSDESDSVEVDEFDDPSMWSPFSLAAMVPEGREGRVYLRNLLVDCNPDSPWGSKPQLFSTLPIFDSADLDGDSTTEI